MTREQVLKHPAYWFEHQQNELFRQFHYYMKSEKINQTQLAERLGMTKGRVSQILRGESNFSMKTLIELGLSIGLIPKINYVPIEQEINEDATKKLEKLKAKEIAEKKTEIINELALPLSNEFNEWNKLHGFEIAISEQIPSHGMKLAYINFEIPTMNYIVSNNSQTQIAV
jgi:transcriptional regulator with XRE-family HTH domain